MRKIHFKAWDIENKRMINSLHNFYYDNKDKCYYCYKTWQDEEDGNRIKCIMLQYTGLKDINKKEIYEGDIVIRTLYGIRGRIHDKDKYIITDDDSICEYPIMSVGFNNTDSLTDIMDNDSFNSSGLEVIGNIYETPELIE